MSLAITLVAAFGGGVFGALIGGTTAFIFTGILALTGIVIAVSGGGNVILTQVAFGPFFGPHIAFVGGVAAAAYVGRKNAVEKQAAAEKVVSAGTLPDVNGADTTIPLFKIKDPVMLLVGGVFGILGYLLNDFYSLTFNLPAVARIDTIALTVATFGVICRLVFGRSGLTGAFPENERRFNFTGTVLMFNAIWGFALSAVVAYAVILLNISSFGFAISAVSLIFLYFGLEFPVSHHVSMVAGYAALAFGNVWIAAVFGILAVITGEYVQRFVNTHVDTHLDMPAIIIASWSFVILGVIS
ncbi:hypothetical protein [Propionispora hippei]|uniref:DUF7973 domain-containing protein n=1 Tax=Propionispora hippei DSM 15287 TaxID=1123003 RepID=A0A1M6H246_9FIRM|nr:hypothetical protein [Propionispora hippei]SHJ16278.1 hypothetical protein SAMN02745170_01865 [Propionispora hippei DSM 15287]